MNPDNLHRKGATTQLLVCCLAVMCGVVWTTFRARSLSPTNLDDREPETSQKTDSQKPAFEVSIRKPSEPPRTWLGKKDAHGNQMTVACSTCHATRKPNPENRVEGDFDEFHQGISTIHGKLTCLACHNENDYDALKLADGTRIEFTDVMQLCAQCHGQQMKDYEHGAHGGMTGHWDLTRGPQKKNNCVDCHRPHQPQFPKMRPTFKPRDRFLDNRGNGHD